LPKIAAIRQEKNLRNVALIESLVFASTADSARHDEQNKKPATR
jgi:hypothetical protein